VGFIFSQKEERKKKKITGFIVCFEQKKRKEHFTLFGRMKDNRKKIF
jgi:hypothetical protein